VHSKEFRADEKKYDRYEEAIAWEKKNLPRLISHSPGSVRKPEIVGHT